MRLLILLLLAFSFFNSLAQGNQSEYLEGKRLFNEGNYRDAMASFQVLTEDPEFGAYATFYYALSAYHQDLPKVALDTWKQVLAKYPTWDQKEEVDFWIAKTALEQKDYLQGVRYSTLLSRASGDQLLSSAIEEVDLEVLRTVFDANNEIKDLAEFYFRVLVAQPYDERDHTMISNLSNRFGFEMDQLVEAFDIVKKPTYAVALVLPFMFDSLQNPQSVIRNRIIYEMYQGMQLAADSLKSGGIDLRLYPYDTYKNKLKTQRIIARGALDNADVIIGPLYSGPNEVILSYSKRKEIPMINPLSSNGSVIADNSFAYLFKPSYDTQGRIAGEYAKERFKRNKRAMIFFETERDQVVAEAYHEMIKDDFEIVLFDEITQETALQMQVDFTEQYEEPLDSLSRSEIDSIADIPGRFVRTRVKRDVRTGSILRNDKGEELLSYYEMKFTIPKDTIGHIFAATSSNLLANNLISLTEVRGDSIGIIGYDDWLNFKLVSYSQLERLDISLINTSYFNGTNQLAEKIRKTYYAEPTEYYYLGFELITQLGKLLNENGKYFQRGLVAGDFVNGILMEGLKYGLYRDNQVVPIVTMKDLELNVENRQSYED